MSDFLRVLYRRALSSRDPGLVQVWFDAAVVERYAGDPSYQVIRTNTAGRVRKQGGWAVDFGIGDGDHTIHASWAALAQALPEGEREHWAMHASPAGGVSENFIRMQLSPGSCFDDGDVRSWR